MRYFVDFEGTLFDSAAFAAHLTKRAPGQGGEFSPGELSEFLYPDAASFLRDKENAVTIVTSGSREAQENKIKSALEGIPRMSVMYTEGVSKGVFLAPHTHLHEGALAVDDLARELEQYASHCAPMALFEIRRDGESGDGRWPVIRSLAELP